MPGYLKFGIEQRYQRQSPQSATRSITPVRSVGDSGVVQSKSPSPSAPSSEKSEVDVGPPGQYEKLVFVPSPNEYKKSLLSNMTAKKSVRSAPLPSPKEIDVGQAGQYEKLGYKTPDGYEKLIPLLLPKSDPRKKGHPKKPKAKKVPLIPKKVETKKAAAKKTIFDIIGWKSAANKKSSSDKEPRWKVPESHSVALVVPTSESESDKVPYEQRQKSDSQGYELMDWQEHGLKRPRFVIVKDWKKGKEKPKNEEPEPPKSYWQRHPQLAWVIIGVLAIALIMAIVAIVLIVVLKSSPSSSTVETSLSPSTLLISPLPSFQLKDPSAAIHKKFSDDR